VAPPIFATVSSTLSVAAHLIGRVIGRGGANLRAVQALTGASVDVDRGDGGARLVTVSGLPANVIVACSMLTQVVEQATLQNGNAPPGGPRTELRVPCDASKVGWVVGQKGVTIKAIRSLSGARVDVLDVQDEGGRRSGCVVLSGTEAEVAEARKALDGLLGARSADDSKAYASQLAAAAEQRSAWDEAQAKAALPSLPPPAAVAEAVADATACAAASEWERRTARHPDGSEVAFFVHRLSGTVSWGVGN
jgi:predicted RNA-binding protein YlqC (UPF0109 family)